MCTVHPRDKGGDIACPLQRFPDEILFANHTFPLVWHAILYLCSADSDGDELPGLLLSQSGAPQTCGGNVPGNVPGSPINNFKKNFHALKIPELPLLVLGTDLTLSPKVLYQRKCMQNKMATNSDLLKNAIISAL